MPDQQTIKLDRLTHSQRKYYLAIVAHIREFHSFPTVVELALTIGVANNAAYEMIGKLCRKHLIEQLATGRYRIKGVIFEPMTIDRQTYIKTHI